MENSDLTGNQPTTLDEIIRSVLGSSKPFEDLEPTAKSIVIYEIKTQQLHIPVFGKRGYDVLVGKFFAYRYLPRSTAFDYTRIRAYFESFDEFVSCLGGDIYTSACYFGYHFSDEEIAKYRIDLKRINLDAFIGYDITDITFESLLTERQSKIAEGSSLANNIFKWFSKRKQLTSYSHFLRTKQSFLKQFTFFGAQDVFLSLIPQFGGPSTKEYVLQFACEEGTLDFSYVYFRFGLEAATFVAENYKGRAYAPLTAKKKKRKWVSLANGLSRVSSMRTLRKGGYDVSTGLFYIDRACLFGVSHIQNRDFYFTLEAMAGALEGNLGHCDFKDAPIHRSNILRYQVDDKTKLPPLDRYVLYSVKTKFDGTAFVVKQTWMDANEEPIIEHTEHFEDFCDAAHFLKGDFSNADLLLCDGIERLNKMPGLLFDCCRLKSEVLVKLGRSIEPSARLAQPSVEFEQTTKFEIATADSFLAPHHPDYEHDFEIAYLSDLHLFHRLKAWNCVSVDDATYVVYKIARQLRENSLWINLLGGDVSSDFDLYQLFLDAYRGDIPKKNYSIFTLGNHELWPFRGETLATIVSKYRDCLSAHGMYLLQNDLLLIRSGGHQIISEAELINLNIEELKEIARDAKLLIFGGMGFAGTNTSFNAEQDIYRGVVSRQEEIMESQKFRGLYLKVIEAFYGKNVVIFTHMPFSDWAGDLSPEEGFIYVSGHNHKNTYFDDGTIRIFADNQIGYRKKDAEWKKLPLNWGYDWFSTYPDGIYEITKDDYEKFYRGINEPLEFARPHKALFMVKRDGNYVFFLKTEKGKLCLLSGGSIRRIKHQDLNYYFEHLSNYSRAIKAFMADYCLQQQKIAGQISALGGSGNIHGTIIDVDFYNHLYLNPFDGTITAYSASSMVDKNVFKNVPSLLKYSCPDLYGNYQRLALKKDGTNPLILVGQNDIELSNATIYEPSTEMYRISRRIKGLQYTTKHNVIRMWDDSLVESLTPEAGRLLIQGLILDQ